MHPKIKYARGNDICNAACGSTYKDLGKSGVVTLDLVQVPAIFSGQVDGGVYAQWCLYLDLVEAVDGDPKWETYEECNEDYLQGLTFLACQEALEQGVSEAWIRGALWDRIYKIWDEESERIGYLKELAEEVFNKTPTYSRPEKKGLPHTEMGKLECERRINIGIKRDRIILNFADCVYRDLKRVLAFRHTPQNEKQLRRRNQRIEVFKRSKERLNACLKAR